MTRTLVALAAGAATYLLTEQIVVGILAAALGFWLLPRGDRRKQPHDRPLEPTPQPPPRTDAAGGIEVVCKQVTPLRQEWVSVRTGRLYDVLSRDGPPDAKPGDHGRVVVTGSGYRIRRASEPG